MSDPLRLDNSSLPGIVSGLVSVPPAPPAPPPPAPPPIEVTLSLPVDTSKAVAHLLSPGGLRELVPLKRRSEATSPGETAQQSHVPVLVAVIPPMARGGAVLILEGLQSVRDL